MPHSFSTFPVPSVTYGTHSVKKAAILRHRSPKAQAKPLSSNMLQDGIVSAHLFKSCDTAPQFGLPSATIPRRDLSDVHATRMAICLPPLAILKNVQPSDCPRDPYTMRD